MHDSPPRLEVRLAYAHMRRPSRLLRAGVLIAAVNALLACGGGQHASTAPSPEYHPLASLAAQKIVVPPTYALRVAPELGWSGRIGRQRDVLKQMDDDIAAVLEDRGIKQRWVLPAALVRSWKSNPTYASDPYALGEEPIRSASLESGTRLPEPLASQLRTMVALHDSRFVLAPVELRFERATSNAGSGASVPARAVLHVVLLDARLSEVRWVGDVRGDTASSFGPALTASVATHLADLITAP